MTKVICDRCRTQMPANHMLLPGYNILSIMKVDSSVISKMNEPGKIFAFDLCTKCQQEVLDFIMEGKSDDRAANGSQSEEE